jgi:Flp pilus assembly protein TadG
MRIRQDERGQVLVLAALCLTALLGFVALATDVGLLFRAKRNLQIAADAAASAGALDYLYNASNSSAIAAANAAAAQNGETNGSGGAVVTVNIPPQYGYHTTTGHVEVIITQANPTFFMNIFNINSVTVPARAVAGTPSPSQDCVTVLNPSASGAMTLQGSFDVAASKCNVVVDSSSSDALQFTGAGGTLTARSVSVVGGDGGQTGDSTPPPVTGIAPVSDPLQLTGPAVPGSCTYTSSATSITNGNAAATAGGVVCFTNTSGVTLTNLTLSPATYVFEHGVTLSGAVTGLGVTLDVYGGDLGITTGTILNLVAPTSGTYNGIVLMDLQSNSTLLTFQIGNSTGTMTGIIYAPHAEFYMNDSGGDSKGGLVLTTNLIVGTFFDKTSSITIYSYNAANPTTTPLRAVSLVE